MGPGGVHLGLTRTDRSIVEQNLKSDNEGHEESEENLQQEETQGLHRSKNSLMINWKSCQRSYLDQRIITITHQQLSLYLVVV